MLGLKTFLDLEMLIFEFFQILNLDLYFEFVQFLNFFCVFYFLHTEFVHNLNIIDFFLDLNILSRFQICSDS
jgi:hypothetical protein